MNIDKLYELLLSDKPSELLLCYEDELLSMIPELRICKGFNQNNKWHVYDVYEHILHVVDGVPADLDLRLAALFHDVGKPLSYKEDEQGNGHFFGHWDESIKIFERFASKYGIDEDTRRNVSNLISYHDLNVDRLNEEQLNRMCQLFGKDGIVKLFQLKRADLLAQNKKYHYMLDDYDIQKQKIISRFNYD